MSRAKTRPIDGQKLKSLILDRGYITHISADIGYSPSRIHQAINDNRISMQMATILEAKFGIKYEDYKPEEKEPVQEDEPIIETTVVSKDEALLKTIITQLSALNNGLTAIYKKLEEL